MFTYSESEIGRRRLNLEIRKETRLINKELYELNQISKEDYVNLLKKELESLSRLL